MSSPAYLRPYEQAVDLFGSGFTSLLWRSRGMQEMRFAVIANLVPLRGHRVADLGAGRGDLYFWAKGEGCAPAAYVGVEALPAFAETCRERLAGEAGAAMVEADFVADEGLFDRLAGEDGIDTIVFSGSLNTLDEGVALAVLDRAWRAVRGVERGALVFNFLSDSGPQAGSDPPAPARRFDTLGVVRWALERTSLVRFRHDYLDGQDATVAMLGGVGMPSAYEPPR